MARVRYRTERARHRGLRWAVQSPAVLLALCLLAFSMLLAGSAVYAAGDDVKIEIGGGGLEPGGAPEPATSEATKVPTPLVITETTGWEVAALADFAGYMGWPPTVNIEAGGKMLVQLYAAPAEWALASVRSFESEAGAAAAFEAETEDTRLAGYRITPGLFYGASSYRAEWSQGGPTPIERRFHWSYGRWVFGVDVHGTTAVMRSLDPSVLSRQLLSVAVSRGAPLPPSGVLPEPEPSASPPAATSTPVPCDASFTDVGPSHWAAGYISALACRGIIGGYADGSFRPQNPTTRAQLAKMIVLAEDWLLANPSSPTFHDVGTSHIFYRYVETAYARGVVQGYDGGLFRPDAPVTRAQVAKMLVRARGWLIASFPVASLCDVRPDHWAYGYVQTAIQHGAFNGYSNGCFYPDAYATRAQLAKVIVQSDR